MKAYRGSKKRGKEFVKYLRCHSEERGIAAKCRNEKRSLLDSLIAAAFLRLDQKLVMTSVQAQPEREATTRTEKPTVTSGTVSIV